MLGWQQQDPTGPQEPSPQGCTERFSFSKEDEVQLLIGRPRLISVSLFLIACVCAGCPRPYAEPRLRAMLNFS